MNLGVSLPDELVQHIQSFMNFKETARSATLCSTLYQTWYNSSQLDLDERQFGDVNAFWRGAKTTVKRYRHANLSLETCMVQLVCGYERYYDCRRLLQDVSELGAKEINIRIFNENFHCLIPSSVFGSANLITFSLVGGALHMGYELPGLCTSIQSLCLVPTRFTGARGDLITNYVMRYPSLKSLSCPGFLLFADYECLESWSRDLESLTIHNLDYPDNVYFAEVLSLFHKLKTLTIRQVLNGPGLRISSHSLKHISIEDRYRDVATVIIAPNLHYFHFVGVSCSCFTFESTDKLMVYDIKVVCYRSNDRWFISLHNLLRHLEAAKINLSVHIKSHTSDFIYSPPDIGVPVAVEKLELVTESLNPQLVETLMCVCRPQRFSYNHYVN